MADPQSGVQSTISKRGMDHIMDVVVSLLRQQLENVRLPDQKGKASSPIGHIKYELKDILLSGPNFGTVSLRNDGGGIRLDISAVTCHIHMKWRYKYHFVSRQW
ncbi:hypothetical protein GEMRC1_007964 [Eukaryota sp. GEM-RC1]